MPILPIIDLLIFIGWSCLAAGALLKAIYVTTRYRPDVLGLGPLEFMMISGIFLLFALTLAARTYVKAIEPGMLAKKRAASALRSVSDAKMENDASVAEAKANNGFQAEKAAGS